jgi:nitrite reductase/ring-hydroxylating ferredoxin subunit
MRYDVTTGSTISSPGYGVASYPAKVVDGKILVAVT